MKFIRKAALSLALASLALIAQAQEFPTRTVRLIVPYAPGATTDALARMLALELSRKWPHPVIVENVPGASGGIGAQMVNKAAPDGHTLLVTPGGVLTTNPYLFPKLVYDPDALAPVGVIARTPLVILASTKSGIGSLQDLLTVGKQKGRNVTYASQGIGNMAHLAPELLKSLTGIEMTHVPYKGSAPAIQDLLAGHVDVMVCTDLATALPHLREGRMKALAFCDDKRNSLLPAVPTVTETIPGFLASGWFRISAPANTPRALIDKISVAAAEVLKTSDAMARITALNVEAVGSTPAEMAHTIQSERQRWSKVIRDNGIKAE